MAQLPPVKRYKRKVVIGRFTNETNYGRALLTDEEYYDAIEEHGDEFEAHMGAEAIQQLLSDVDLKEEIATIYEQLPLTTSETKLKKLAKRLKLLEALTLIMCRMLQLVILPPAEQAIGTTPELGRAVMCQLLLT